MKKSKVVSAIRQILETKVKTQGIENFSENARLYEDLYLDSVLILQLLVNLEKEIGIEIPDDALSGGDFITISSMADFLLGQNQHDDKNQQAASLNNNNNHDGPTEEFEDIKVHCFVSCLCEIIKADERVDHRPFYFGVWDAEVIVDDNHQLDYHSQTLNHDFFKQWYERLYGVPIVAWYRPEWSKKENINTLIKLLEEKSATQKIMVMLDMFRLPERENKFSQNPFPHYVLLEKTSDPSRWFMSDPDFRWEGILKKSQIIHSIESNAVAGGYYFDSQAIRPSTPQDIYHYFTACINTQKNPMTDSVRKIIDFYLTDKVHPGPHLPYKNIDSALKQLPVLAIRKYAYEHGFAFFWRALSLTDNLFESWCEIIEQLVANYKKIQFRAIKIAALSAQDSIGRATLANEIGELLDKQDETEFMIKRGLIQVFNQWCQQHNFGPLVQPDSGTRPKERVV